MLSLVYLNLTDALYHMISEPEVTDTWSLDSVTEKCRPAWELNKRPLNYKSNPLLIEPILLSKCELETNKNTAVRRTAESLSALDIEGCSPWPLTKHDPESETRP